MRWPRNLGATGSSPTRLAPGPRSTRRRTKLFEPEFGFRSAALHREGGARPIAGDLTRLRRDVDDAADLADAISIGVGAHTAVVVAGLPAEIT